MKKKRIVKQLMAAGIQRNDAVNFVETYRKIKNKKMDFLFSDLIVKDIPAPKIFTETRRVQRMVANHTESRERVEGVNAIVYESFIKDCMAGELVRKLLKIGAAKFSKYETLYGYEYILEFGVVIPE